MSDFTITRLKYSGGGDWYSDPSSIPNLLKFLKSVASIYSQAFHPPQHQPSLENNHLI